MGAEHPPSHPVPDPSPGPTRRHTAKSNFLRKGNLNSAEMAVIPIPSLR